jgi:LuxR family transcriptional regulator, quorum-sensing system regulator BjaR1
MSFERTLGYIERLDRAKSERDIVDQLLGAISDYGFKYALAGTVPNRLLSSADFKSSILLKAWPDEWSRRYVERSYVRHDPVIRRLRSSAEAFGWQDCVGPVEDRIMCEAGDHGLRSGFAIPFLTIEGEIAGISLAGDAVELGATGASTVSTISCYAIARAMRLRGQRESKEKATLTARERECLAWSATGKSDWDVSVILGISESTVEKHLRGARVKLAAANRCQAVATASRIGVIL